MNETSIGGVVILIVLVVLIVFVVRQFFYQTPTTLQTQQPIQQPQQQTPPCVLLSSDHPLTVLQTHINERLQASYIAPLTTSFLTALVQPNEAIVLGNVSDILTGELPVPVSNGLIAAFNAYTTNGGPIQTQHKQWTTSIGLAVKQYRTTSRKICQDLYCRLQQSCAYKQPLSVRMGWLRDAQQSLLVLNENVRRSIVVLGRRWRSQLVKLLNTDINDLLQEAVVQGLSSGVAQSVYDEWSTYITTQFPSLLQLQLSNLSSVFDTQIVYSIPTLLSAVHLTCSALHERSENGLQALPPPTSCTQCTLNGPCVDFQNDPNHCGTCPTQCPLVTNGTPVCLSGLCDCVCQTGFARCAADVCADLMTSHDHCGACNQACLLSESCCDGGCSDMSVDPTHCGACDRACFVGRQCIGGFCECTINTECPAGQSCVLGMCQ